MYCAADGEISLDSLFRLANKHRKKCYFPVLTPQNMTFRQQKAAHKFYIQNQFGIREPNARAASIDAQQLDLVLLPLVGFDQFGNRLGMGGGYYDKTFSFCRKRFAGPLLVGVAHHCQKVAQLRPDAWDITLDLIVTDKEIIRCR